MNRFVIFVGAVLAASISVASACTAAPSEPISFTLSPERGSDSIQASFSSDRGRGRADHWSVGRRHRRLRGRGSWRRTVRGLRRLRGECPGRVVGRGHRRAAGGPAGRRTGERGQAGAHRERIASGPQRRRPPGHHVPPFGVSRYVGRRTCVNTGEGGRRRSAATLPRMHLALLVLRHPSLDRVAPRAATLVVP